ncbi:hypothetical protein EDD27_2905 [Nonomuraea polychroma]|uniref:Uncharacterized protein n=1 Tax=Nonomuraea polychroma TaxID=46176 RepID=A0A438M3V6_9ACTN|nr:hypothetical protein EDD27_2905 [Nonomuraea polychroma]
MAVAVGDGVAPLTDVSVQAWFSVPAHACSRRQARTPSWFWGANGFLPGGWIVVRADDQEEAGLKVLSARKAEVSWALSSHSCW